MLIRHRLAIAGLIPHISGTQYPSVTRAETPVRRSRSSSHVYAVEEGTRGDIPLCQKHTDPHISVLICHRLATAGLIPHISGTHYPSVTRAEASVRRRHSSSTLCAVEEGTFHYVRNTRIHTSQCLSVTGWRSRAWFHTFWTLNIHL